MWKNSTVQSPRCTYLTVMLPLMLPPLPWQGPLDDNVRKALQIMSASYNNSAQLLLQDDHDPLYSHIHLNQLQRHIFPLYHALSTKVHHADWVESCVYILGRIVTELQTTIKNSEERCMTSQPLPKILPTMH